jgi:hypothetical protein
MPEDKKTKVQLLCLWSKSLYIPNLTNCPTLIILCFQILPAFFVSHEKVYCVFILFIYLLIFDGAGIWTQGFALAIAFDPHLQAFLT